MGVVNLSRAARGRCRGARAPRVRVIGLARGTLTRRAMRADLSRFAGEV